MSPRTTARKSLVDLDATRRVGLVVRVSTTRQADNDEGSLKNQLQRLRGHLEYKTVTCGEDWREVALYELRAVSGKNSLKSLEMERLRRDIEEGEINTVLCTALDRVSRSVVDFLTFFEFMAEHGAEFVCLKQNYDTTSPQGRLFVTIMMALAQFEREMTADRTRDAVAARSERGLWNGGRILGYDLDPDRKGYLRINDVEAEVVRAAFQLYLECGSLSLTAERLNERGYRTKEFVSRRGKLHPGTPFHLTGVQYLLKNPAYVALKEINKEQRKLTHDDEAAGYRTVPAVWPAIIDRALFDRVQALMETNGQTRTNQAREHKHVYVLNSGLLWCGACGGPMEGRSGTGRLGQRYYYYKCRNAECGIRVVAPEVEDAVLAKMGSLAGKPGILERLVAATNTKLQRQLPVLGKRKKALERELADVKSQADKLLGGWSAEVGAGVRSLVAEKLGTLAERQEQLGTAIREVEAQITQVQQATVSVDAMREALAQVGEVYGQLMPIERKELFRLLVHRAEVTERRMVLEIKTGARGPEGQALDTGGERYNSPDWLPESVTQSVVRDRFKTLLPSYERIRARRSSTRRRQGKVAVAAEWQAMLDDGAVDSRASLAREMGVSRARVTQVLANLDADDMDNDVCTDFQHGDLERLALV